MFHKCHLVGAISVYLLLFSTACCLLSFMTTFWPYSASPITVSDVPSKLLPVCLQNVLSKVDCKNVFSLYAL